MTPINKDEGLLADSTRAYIKWLAEGTPFVHQKISLGNNFVTDFDARVWDDLTTFCRHYVHFIPTICQDSGGLICLTSLIAFCADWYSTNGAGSGYYGSYDGAFDMMFSHIALLQEYYFYKMFLLDTSDGMCAVVARRKKIHRNMIEMHFDEFITAIRPRAGHSSPVVCESRIG